MNRKDQPRHGGKPLGWRKPQGTRKPHMLRAYDDEWQLVQKFAKIIKWGDRERAEKFLAEVE